MEHPSTWLIERRNNQNTLVTTSLSELCLNSAWLTCINLWSSSHFAARRIPNSLDGTFDRLGFNKKPTLFGCNEDSKTPLVLYLPNYKAVAETDIESGVSTYSVCFNYCVFTLIYWADALISGNCQGELVNQFFDNGFAIASQSAGPYQDSEWSQCIACFLIDKQLQRSLKRQTPQCLRCLERYCAIFWTRNVEFCGWSMNAGVA